jgi:hypothetical protein
MTKMTDEKVTAVTLDNIGVIKKMCFAIPVMPCTHSECTQVVTLIVNGTEAVATCGNHVFDIPTLMARSLK